MKYIFTLLFLSSIAYSMSINKVGVDLQLIHQQNTETVSPIIFEPGPVFDSQSDTQSDTQSDSQSDSQSDTQSVTPSFTLTITPTETFILYETYNTNDDTNNPPSSFVIQQSQHIQQNQQYQHNKQNHIPQEQQNQYNQPNILLPNPPIY